MTTYFKDLDGSVLQRKTHMDHSKIYERKIQTYSDLLNLLRHVITISGDDFPATSKMLIPILTSLKSVYQRGPLPVPAPKVRAHQDDDDDGHGDNTGNEHVSGRLQKSRRIKGRSNSSKNQPGDKGLHVISKLFNNNKQ